MRLTRRSTTSTKGIGHSDLTGRSWCSHHILILELELEPELEAAPSLSPSRWLRVG